MKIDVESLDIREVLKLGKVHFSYIKKDGSHRSAYGTLHPSLISAPARSGGGGGSSKPRDPDLITYFDLEKGGFRCFFATKFLSCDCEPLDEDGKPKENLETPVQDAAPQNPNEDRTFAESERWPGEL